MASIADLARLDVLIELFSECANASDIDALFRVAAGRLRSVLEFDRCAFMLARGSVQSCWIGERVGDTLRRAVLADVSEGEATLLERVYRDGAPAGRPPGLICVPMQVGDKTLGAICFSHDVDPYTSHDICLGHHAGQYLASLVARIDLEGETLRLRRRKDDLLALLSHELRNPLAPIVTAVHLLKTRAGAETSKELEIIGRQAEHLVRLVDDLLDVARMTRGKTTLHRSAVEIADIVGHAVEMMSPLLEERGHTLDLDVAGEGLRVHGDAGRLAQVVSNLLSNAAHYTEAGGHIVVTARRDEQCVVLDVRDNGVGIAASELPHVFDVFVQGSNRASGPGGLGLGLVVVKELTERHGGSVSVASAGDSLGTTFTVRLPLASSAASLPAPTLGEPSPAPVPQPKVRQRVLLVDDNEDALELLATFVKHAGHDVTIARGGHEALSVFEAARPSIAVFDITMPLMDGYELAARIRADPRAPQPYLVALTGYGQSTDRERTRAAGFDEHLVKPVDLSLLLRVLARGHHTFVEERVQSGSPV